MPNELLHYGIGDTFAMPSLASLARLPGRRRAPQADRDVRQSARDTCKGQASSLKSLSTGLQDLLHNTTALSDGHPRQPGERIRRPATSLLLATPR